MKFFSSFSLETVLQSLYDQIDTEGRKSIVNVDRYNVLEGGFRALQRKSFKETNLLSVKFSGECAVDNGGPSREFLHLSIKSLKELNIFEGESDAKLLAMDYKGTYYYIKNYSPIHRPNTYIFL